jgi:hypothetical protein
MRGDEEDQVNEWRPPVSSKIAAWMVFVFVSVLVLALLYLQLILLPRNETVFPPSSAEKVVAVVYAVPMECWVLHFVLKKYAFYRWNGRGIARCMFWREHRVAWEHITAFKVGLLGSVTLSDAAGGRMKLSSRLLGDNPHLYEMLAQELARREDVQVRKIGDEVRNIEDSGEARFSLGFSKRAFVVRGDSLLYKERLETQAIMLSESAYMCRRILKHPSGTVLVTGGGRRVFLPIQTKQYLLLIAYIRSRAANAIVLNLDLPEPSGGLEKVGYLHGRIELARQIAGAAKLSLISTAIGLTLVVLPILLLEPLLASDVVAMLVLSPAFFIGIPIAIADVKKLVQTARETRRLQERLAAITADGGLDK